MEKKLEKNCCSIKNIAIVIFLLVLSICISFAGCAVTQEVVAPGDNSSAIDVPDTTNKTQYHEETESTNVPKAEPSVPTETEKTPVEIAHVHSYTSKTVAPSCAVEGYTSFICNCGDTYTANRTEATGHSYRESISAATCTEMGYTTYTCSVCSDSYTDKKTNATGHSWGNWTVTKEPTTSAEGTDQRTCNTCGITDSRMVEKLAYPTFTDPIGVYDIRNVPYTSHTGDTEQAAFISVYTTEKSDAVMADLVAEFQKAYGYSPMLDDPYRRCTSSCRELGTYIVEGYSTPQTVYRYIIMDKSYIYITNPMYQVYVQLCDDGDIWVGYCIYGTMGNISEERNRPEVKALDKEMRATFASRIGLSEKEMDANRDKYDLMIGYISAAGTVRSVHSDGLVNVLYIYCRGSNESIS